MNWSNDVGHHWPFNLKGVKEPEKAAAETARRRAIDMMRENEVEVFRKPLIPDTCYEYAEYTHKTGKFPVERYYTLKQPRYVGKHVSSHGSGVGGNGEEFWEIFNNNGKRNRVDYSYAGHTAFRPVDCRPSEADAPNSGAGVGGGKRRRTSKRRRRNRRKTTQKY